MLLTDIHNFISRYFSFHEEVKSRGVYSYTQNTTTGLEPIVGKFSNTYTKSLQKYTQTTIQNNVVNSYSLDL
jgi:hypothetical protein